MKLSRREAIKLGLISSGSFLLSQNGVKQALAEPRRWQEFQSPLSLLPPLQPIASREMGYQGQLTDYYEITISACKQLIGDELVDIWGYNGSTPGPIIWQRGGAKKQEKRYAVIRFINKLGMDPEHPDEPIKVVVHLHGMASKPQYDGYAEDYIKHGEYKDYIYPNDRAATIWYHDHTLDKTTRNVKAGLLGMYIVEDEFERQCPLPKGEFDLPLILQEYPQILQGPFPDIDRRVIVNGVLKPYLSVKRHKYRLRILNATPESIFKLTIDHLDPQEQKLNAATLVVVASDGGLREDPVFILPEDDPLEIGPGERYELIVDFNEVFNRLQTNQVYLRLEETNPALNPTRKGAEKILRFAINSTPIVDDSQIPPVIRPVRRFDCGKPRRTFSRNLALAGLEDKETLMVFDNQGPPAQCLAGAKSWSINGKVWQEKVAWRESKVVDVPLEECVIWRFDNPSREIHPVHIHQIDLQFVDRFDGTGKSTLKPYQKNCWKDSFFIRPGESARVVGRFGPWEGVYMIHCHNIRHEDCAMMVTFQVGQDERDPSTLAPAKLLAMIDNDPLVPVTTIRGTRSLLTQPTFETEGYDSERIEQFNLEQYGED